jgi:hypothetical protein
LVATFRTPAELILKHAVYVPVNPGFSRKCPFFDLQNLRFLDISHDILIFFLKKIYIARDGRRQFDDESMAKN